jgi:hypothetical protein
VQQHHYAALSVECRLARLQGEDLPVVDSLVLQSPAIRGTPAAALAVWQARIAGRERVNRPVARMWHSGIITLSEMQLTQLIMEAELCYDISRVEKEKVSIAHDQGSSVHTVPSDPGPDPG